MLEISAENVARKSRRTSYNLSTRSLSDLRAMSNHFEVTVDEALACEALTIVYNRLTVDIEYMIRQKSRDSQCRNETVRAIQVMSCLDRDLRVCTRMTPRVAACVYYQLRCKRVVAADGLLPYDNVPWVLDMSTPLSKTSVVHWDEVDSTAQRRAVAKIARAPPSNPEYYYERRRLSASAHRDAETRLEMLPSRCEGLTWDRALDVVLEHERIPELESAPPEVHAYVSSSRARLQRDMRLTSKSKRCCINRDCRRSYPCHSGRSSRIDSYEQIRFHLFPNIDRQFERYWSELLSNYPKTSVGPASFCSNLCLKQSWVPCMRDTLGTAQWALHADDTDTLETHGVDRVHAVLKCLVDRNKDMNVKLKHLIERDRRSSTCLRERDVKAMAEMMMHTINMDTAIVLLMSTLRAENGLVKDPCPIAWRAKLSNDEMRQYVDGAVFLLNTRHCWHTNPATSLIYTVHDITNLQRYCRQRMRTHAGLFVRLR